MSVPILSCPCGLRMKARGAIPGRVGRCPKCGRTLTVPDLPAPGAGRIEGDAGAGSAPRGYGLNPTSRPAVAAPAAGWAGSKPARRRPVEPSLAPEDAPESGPGWRADLLFPLRGAEGVITVAILGLAAWGAATLTPELGLTFVADSARSGATLMGMLVAMIAGLPGMLVGFLAVVYALQYLGRVLVSAAMGESKPPRPPDRNFDGLFEGLAPWPIWLACGASVGLAPLAAYLGSRGGGDSSKVMIVLLAALGLPYAWMALLMTFLDDGGFPRPVAVVGALVRYRRSFLAPCGLALVLGVVVAGAFVAVLALREEHFWIYVPLMLACWTLAAWAGVVAMRGLGVFYHRHASSLRWHRQEPWWGVTPGG